MEQHGDPPPPIGMKWGPCPFCKKKSTARITDDGQQLFFKCANDTCPSQTAGEGNAWTELHYLSFKTGLKGKEVFIAYLKEANVWKEVERYKNLNEVPPAEAAAPEPAETAEPESGSDEELIGKAIEMARREDKVSKELLRKWFSIGSGRADRILDELEKRGIIGPARSNLPREVIKPEVVRSEAQMLDDDIEKWIHYIGKLEKRKFNFIDVEKAFGFARAKEVFEALKERKIIRPVGNDGDMEMVPKAPAVVFISSREQQPNQPPALAGGEDGYMALYDFFTQLSLVPDDFKNLFLRRGLETKTIEALRFRSSPKLNRGKLLQMVSRFDKQELLDSGLFVRVKKSKKLKPNSQFCGAGIARKAKEGEKPARNEWKDNDGNIWGWCQPILIPYFDELGRLVGLRPHKGGGPANTATGIPRIYVPRGPRGSGDQKEFFPRVVITEGEFKAAGLWQQVGAGRDDGKEPFGVVALPGIWFGQNYGIREELDQWLRDVRCRVVKVAYDNEEKGNPELASFKEDRRKRFDAQICARVLATDIASKLQIRSETIQLPDAWRNEKGKADWDGALVKMGKPREPLN